MWRDSPTGRSRKRSVFRREPARLAWPKPEPDCGKLWPASAWIGKDEKGMPEMENQELEHRLAELRESWRVPRDPPLADMWQVIESRAFGPGRTQGSRWIRTLLPMAATLVLGFGLGQLTPELVGNRPSEPVGTAAQEPPEAAAPFVGIATNYLERVTALLVTLTDESRLGRPLDYSNERARDLLATTRLLLDSPGITDPHLRAPPRRLPTGG